MIVLVLPQVGGRGAGERVEGEELGTVEHFKQRRAHLLESLGWLRRNYFPDSVELVWA